MQGAFGPWAAKEPGDTPLNGDYVFKDADLSVFQGIQESSNPRTFRRDSGRNYCQRGKRTCPISV